MNRYKWGSAAGLLLWLTLAGAQTTTAPTQRITPNFKDVEIADLANAVGKATGLTFIATPQVRGTVSLINPPNKAMSPSELYEIFLQTLQTYGFATSRTGNIVKIVPEANIMRMAGVTLPTKINPNSDEVVTTALELKNISAQQFTGILRQLTSANGGFSQWVTGTNSLILIDRASNVARIQKVLAELDTGNGNGLDMIALKNSNAKEVATTLTTLLQVAPADAAAGAPPKVVADDRTNSVLVSGDATARAKVAKYVADLDKLVADDDNIETRYLKYARAEDVANTLKQQANTILATTSANAGAAAPGAAAAASANASADRSVNIQFDKPTNMLIVMAPPKTRRSLMQLVDKMDIPRAKVLLEAFIADITIDKSRDLGVNWSVFSQEDGKVVPGALFDSSIGNSGNNPIDLATLAQIINDPSSASTIPQGATFALGKIVDTGLSWAAMIRALTSDTNTNVIANPTQMTLDNEQVTLTSGQQVPFVTGQYSNTGGGGGGGIGGGGGSVNPFTTVQRQDVGTTLKVTPQLNGSDAMLLTIDLESSELAGQTGDAGSQITNKRTFHNVVLVKNRQPIVIGGLIRDSDSTSETRVPFLSSIPIIGQLFRVKNHKRSKSNLMVFIRPTIITSDIEADNVTNGKYRDIIETQRLMQEKNVKLPAPQMPDLNSSGAMPAAPEPAGKKP